MSFSVCRRTPVVVQAAWQMETLRHSGRAMACRDSTGSGCTWREALWSSKGSWSASHLWEWLSELSFCKWNQIWSFRLYFLLIRLQIWFRLKKDDHKQNKYFCSSFSKLILTVDSTDDNYMPKRVTVYGGEGDNLKKYSDVPIDE